MPNLNPGPGERLEALARRPLQPRRELLLELAGRLAALEALERQRPFDLEVAA